MFCNNQNSNFNTFRNRQMSYQRHSLFSRLFFCKYFQSRFQDKFLTLSFNCNGRKNLKVLFWYQMEAAQCLFFYYSFPFFLFAWTDSGRQNSICRGQQPNLYIPSSSIETQINLASFLFLGRLEVRLCK